MSLHVAPHNTAALHVTKMTGMAWVLMIFDYSYFYCILNEKYFLSNVNNLFITTLLQSLMTGLMYNRPEDHIAYLQDCLKTLEAEKGDEPVTWNRFCVASKALPPIPSEHRNGLSSPSSETGSTKHEPSDSSHAAGTYFFYLSTGSSRFFIVMTLTC